jgi:hypothetical protein
MLWAVFTQQIFGCFIRFSLFRLISNIIWLRSVVLIGKVVDFFQITQEKFSYKKAQFELGTIGVEQNPRFALGAYLLHLGQPTLYSFKITRLFISKL